MGLSGLFHINDNDLPLTGGYKQEEGFVAMRFTVTGENSKNIEISNLTYGQFVVLEGVFETRGAKSCRSFCEPYMYRNTILVENYDHGSLNAFSKGACYFVHMAKHFYRFSFIVPKGVDRMDLHIACGDGVLNAEEVDVYATDKPEKVISAIKCVAHLGYTGLAPRNTMHSFELAGLAGFRECVLNINYTKDGKIVTLHNDTIDASSNGTGSIREMTYDEANKFDYGIRYNPFYKGTKLPLMSEVIELLDKYHVKPVLRLSNDTSTEQAEKIVSILSSKGVSRFTAKAFSKEALRNFCAVAGDMARYGYCIQRDFAENLDFMSDFPAADKYLDVRSEVITEEFAAAATARDVALEAWIENNFTQIVNLAKLGVSGFTTDLFMFDNYVI